VALILEYSDRFNYTIYTLAPLVFLWLPPVQAAVFFVAIFL
jgi:hypothetical protein